MTPDHKVTVEELKVILANLAKMTVQIDNIHQMRCLKFEGVRKQDGESYTASQHWLIYAKNPRESEAERVSILTGDLSPEANVVFADWFANTLASVEIAERDRRAKAAIDKRTANLTQFMQATDRTAARASAPVATFVDKVVAPKKGFFRRLFG